MTACQKTSYCMYLRIIMNMSDRITVAMVCLAKINFERIGFIWLTGYSPLGRQAKWQLKAGTEAETMNNWNVLFCLFCLSQHPFNTASDKLPRGGTHSGLNPPLSIGNHMSNWWKQFLLSWRCFDPTDCNLWQIDYWS